MTLLILTHKEDPAAVVLEDKTVQQGDSLTIEMTNGGGFVAFLEVAAYDAYCTQA